MGTLNGFQIRYQTSNQIVELRDDRIAAFAMSELLDYAERGTIKIIEKLPSIKLK